MKRSLLFLALAMAVAPLFAAQVQILLPLGRTAYQTNERITLGVVRSNAQALPAGTLTLTVTGADGSVINSAFPVPAVPVAGNDARSTEYLQLNGWLLRPGAYTVAISVDDAQAQSTITLYSHVRRSTYRTVHWGGPGGAAMAPEGEDGMGFNLILGGVDEPSIRGGEDIMGNDIMGGGHQFDLKMANDWSDPYVYLGANQRGMDVAFSFRTMPNSIGAHLYDEPGLTWGPNPRLKDKDGKPAFDDHDIPTQRAAYKYAFDEEAIYADDYNKNPQDPVNAAKWQQLNDFKLGFMDAFWKSSKQALTHMKPDYLVATQSQYGWTALYDGYYFNVVRSLPVVSGHGGYSSYWMRNFNPSFFLEYSLPRQLDKPNWYLPEWEGEAVINPDAFRFEHNLSFITGIQGMSTPPTVNINSAPVAGIIESNKLFARLGTIFAKPQYTPQDLAILYSKSNAYTSIDEPHQPNALGYAYTAAKLIQYPFSAIVDEDIIDGTLLNTHKAVLLTAINYLDPAVINGLEAFIKAGGVVLVTADCGVKVPGATQLNVKTTALSDAAQAKVKAEPDKKKSDALALHVNSFKAVMDYSQPLAKALKSALAAKGIMPTFSSTVPTIAAGKQVRGEIEYDFAVNFTSEGYGENTTDYGYGKPVIANAVLGLPNDGRPIYNAIAGAPLPVKVQGNAVTADVQFGPGQMLVMARTARPIGGVTVSTPLINCDLTREEDIQRLEFTATLLDAQKNVLAGTAPLQITITDPLGAVRYDLYRATENGVCALSLPIAANDPSGKWTVKVTELLSNTSGVAAFTYKPLAQCGPVAGLNRRAIYYPYDKDNIYQFFRNYRTVTIVTGKSAYNAAAAERLVAILAPYNVHCTVVTAADANKPRELSEQEAKTWCGTSIAGDAKPGRANNPAQVGYDLPGPSILLGNTADNPLIAHLANTYSNKSALPYKLSADFPGRGRGMLAWNFASLGHDLESVACIANDAEGMSEAVGTLFQLGIGLDELTPLALPLSNSLTPAVTLVTPPAAAILWQTNLPDRITQLTAEAKGAVAAQCANGTGWTVTVKGTKVSLTSAPPAVATVAKPSIDVSALPKDKLCADLKVKQVLAGDGLTAVSYWGGRLQLFDATGNLKSMQQLPQDITAITWDNGDLLVGLADGGLRSLNTK